MSQKLVFFGATAFGEIAEIVYDINAVQRQYEIAGILDDNEALHGESVDGYAVLGPLGMARDMDDAQFVFGIGSYRLRLIRHSILQRLGIPRERYATLVHPSATVYSTATIGCGSIIFPGAVVFGDTVVEDYVQILANSVIGVRNRICEGALITSLVTTTDSVMIGHYSHIGTGVAVAEKKKIGPGAQVAMGSLVLHDIPPGVFAFGNPPRYLNKLEIPEAIIDRWVAMTAGTENG